MITVKRDCRLDLRQVTASGSFEGYGSVFGNADLDNDIVERGAFKASLKEKGPAGIKLLWQHDWRQPIGVYDEIREDDRGLYVKGRLLVGDVGQAREAHALLREGALDGLSIGFRTVKDLYDSDSRERTIIEADLWEISLVTFPANPEARVSAVKQFTTVRQVEVALRDVFGLSQRQSKRAAPHLMSIIGDRDDPPAGLDELAAAVKARGDQLNRLIGD